MSLSKIGYDEELELAVRTTLSTLFAVAVMLIGRAEEPTRTAVPTVPLFEGLGKHTRKVATAKPDAQRYFDQGLMSWDETRRQLESFAKIIPEFKGN